MLPQGYGTVRVGAARLIARVEWLDGAARAVAEHGSLHAWAASRPAAKALAGRGPVWAVEPPGATPPTTGAMAVPAALREGPPGRAEPGAAPPDHGDPAPGSARWVVRHYRRGGAVARWLGDRYLRLGLVRPMRELRASVAARARSVHTPEVLAVVIYPAAGFYRADLATAEIPDSMDLAAALWAEHPAAADPASRPAALAAAGALLRELGDAGIMHPDLNAKNILLAGSPPVAYALDLDGCRVGPPLSWRRRREAQARLDRSLRKWERRTGRQLSTLEWAALRAALEAAARPVPTPETPRG